MEDKYDNITTKSGEEQDAPVCIKGLLVAVGLMLVTNRSNLLRGINFSNC
ncbi:hypothetical protein [Sphingobacterium paucimobilis]|uniref:Uncharacterized protein n=1 Tax=Sphingobacterium paucimobilis HER1398 TaxID=1346330 RepID=U2JEW9_9SPHI|nr:hypothetical protein [Sphingobacterium paucimobilis]ERJ61218.1 hypothetical protein M472_20915 [Sphingobacterium paucimobilis HER1398]